ncbi:MAG: hypothetical protein ABJC19_04020 [Gemmatimonadota bacterium]
MRLIRRICATALVASVTLMAACGSGDTPTSSDAQKPSLGTNLDFTVSNTTPNFVAEGGAQANPRTMKVFIGGLIAAASYPSLGTPVYAPSTNNKWLTVSTAPQFSRDPLGFSFDFTVDRTGLADGLYTATIPVTVVGARNNPQTITVAFAVCAATNCLFMGSNRAGNLAATNDFNPNDPTPFTGTASKWFQEWRLFLNPGATAYIQVHAGSSGEGTLGDSYIYLWQLPGDSFIGSNDDFCGLDSQFPVTNGTASIVQYRLYISHFSTKRTGTYNVVISPTSGWGSCGGATLRADGGTVPGSWQEAYIAKHGHAF